ncbi:hypothetical protein [Brucella anthropi]|uniref:hypothetical protein n=1 Tax=Brucella anthropi TaxID=529 RepID=UPI00125CDCFC|nr:hypothetical protein [Brucella anthropi]QFP61875.1 hypothetical protein FT787_01495 [Brucella anthropi]
MKGPKHEGDYPDRDTDCQEALSEEITRLMDEYTAGGTAGSMEEINAGISKVNKGIPFGDVIPIAVAAGWSKAEAEANLEYAVEIIRAGIDGTDPNE